MQQSELEDTPIIMFDGTCGLCKAWVNFVLKYDERAIFRFTSLQSASGKSILRKLALTEEFSESIILVQGSRFWLRSTAVLRILKEIGPPFSLFYGLICVPLFF